MLFVVTCALTGYYYVTFSRMIDARLHGERDRVLPRVFARPFEIRRGDNMSQKELLDRLNDLGYAQRTLVQNPGEFAVNGGQVSVVPRAGTHTGKTLIVNFQRAAAPPRRGRAPAVQTIGNRIESLSIGKQAVPRVTMDAPMLTALMPARVKRRQVPLSVLPSRMVQAVLAIEDRRYYSHPGIDPIRMVGALFTNVFGDRPYLEGASTITQQLARNFFLTEEMAVEQQTRQRSPWRKLREQFMAIILSLRASKDEVLELYLNDVYLGNRGSFAIHGVAEAARLYFGRDVTNLSLGEAATIAGIIQSPGSLSPFNSPARTRERRDVVLRAMVDAGFVSADAAERAIKEPLAPVARALDAEAPYFVDFVGLALAEQFPAVTQTTEAVDVYTTLDLHLQRLAQDAVTSGIAKVDQLLSRRRRGRVPQAALIAVDPRTGDILAMVGGRSYNQSQFNRAVSANRQPGSIFKPFVYLAAFERAAEDGTALSPATLVNDEPTTFDANGTPWTPANYENEYDGEITLRRALAMSRNAATVKVAETAGFDRVADLWRRIGAGTTPRAFPSIALGVFEATPYDHCLGIHHLQQRRRDARAAAAAADSARRHRDPRERLDHETRGARGHDIPGHQYDAQRVERRHRRRRARIGIQPGCRRQDRHDQRPARRVVRRLHAPASDGCLGRSRRQSSARPQRKPGGAADLARVHAARARRTRRSSVRGAGKREFCRYRQRHRRDGHSRLPAGVQRIVSGGNGTDASCVKCTGSRVQIVDFRL